MSVRIHQLSKQIGMENRDLISLLQERGYNVSSPSNTIDNISAESLVEEFAPSPTDETPGRTGEAPPEGAESASATQAPEEPTPAAPADPEKAAAHPPVQPSASHLVRTAPPASSPPRAAPPAAAPPRPGPGSPPPYQPRAPIQPAPPRAPVPRQPTAHPVGSQGIPTIKSRDDVEREREARRASPSRPTPQQIQPSAPPRSPDPAAKTAPPFNRPGPAAPPAAGGGPASAPRPPRGPGSVTAPRGPSSPAGSAPPRKAETAEPVVDEKDLKALQLKPPIVVRDFAVQLGLKPFRLISEMMEIGIFASMNQVIEEEVAAKLARRHGYRLELRHRGDSAGGRQQLPAKTSEEVAIDEEKLLESRPPVVTILGHVDHGKTTLLDFIRKTKVVAGEFGGITQHIGAYQIEYKGQKITFLDTPGHSAFERMRERGAEVTDIAVLVVAADDGFMPQTDEALKHIRKAGVPVIVAINKIDLPGADLNRVKSMMQQRNLAPEDLGGEIITVPVSALKGENVNDLLDMILLQAEVMELKANPTAEAEGVVIESQMEQGRGPVGTVLVKRGTLKPGDAIVCGTAHAKVRALMDERAQRVKSAPPSTAVRILGWSEAPEVGAKFHTVKNEREAKRLAEEAEHERKLQTAADTPGQPASLESLMNAIAQNQQKTFRVVVKADVAGSAEAVVSCLEQIKTDKVRLEVIEYDVGPISRNDVALAAASEATILGFNVRQETGVAGQAKHDNVRIMQYNIIYELIDAAREAMAELLDPELRENKLGRAEVRQVFSIARGAVAGCMVVEGNVHRDRFARLLRKNETVHEGRISQLKRFKEDATEVRAGYECGMRIDNFNDYCEGDIIECFEIEKVQPSL